MFPPQVLEGIAAGTIDLAFRRWVRARHVAGGQQRTAVGVIAFDAVDVVDLEAITATEAARAGSDLATLQSWLRGRSEGEVHRIALRHVGADARVTLRGEIPDAQGLAQLTEDLAAIDRRSRRGPWTARLLGVIAQQPGVRAETLAGSLGWERAPFKAAVRRLKDLGLTESLSTGYRLSRRGEALHVHRRGPDVGPGLEVD